MKTLLVLRHAKSSWDHPQLADHDRPLNRRGKADAPRMGEHLKREGFVPDLMITSTARRAVQTATLVAENCGYSEEIVKTRDFYHADPETYFDALRGLRDEIQCAMVVGHNPGMEELVDDITGESVYLTTANIAVIELPILKWPELDYETEGRLQYLWRPKEID
jgi:phosphohistidine phosphatase